MIGKSLNARFSLVALGPERATAILRAALETQAAHLVQVRAQDPRMIAFLVVRADKPSVRLCRTLGFDVRPGGTGAFGLLGEDAASLFEELGPREQTWLRTPCGARETKVFLISGGVGNTGGTALLSLEAEGGAVTIRAGV
jgi:hypothetical protein